MPKPSPTTTQIVPAPVLINGLEQFHDLAAKAREYVAGSKASSTRRAYTNDWRDFESWCLTRGIAPLTATPELVALYVTALAESGKKCSTIQRRLVSISVVFKSAGRESPTAHPAVKAVWAGIKRAKGMAQQGKAAFTVADLRVALSRLPEDVRGLRDRVLMLVGFAGGMRRSEIVGLDVTDASFVSGGIALRLRRSKTDQEGQGRIIGLPFGADPATCPVLNLRRWLNAAQITEGPIFRPVSRTGAVLSRRLDDQSVALIVKRTIKTTGLDPKDFSGHSLRVSFCTVAASAGVADRVIALQTGHKPGSSTLDRYIRRANLFTENAAAKIGL